jgi:hypothetical protein
VKFARWLLYLFLALWGGLAVALMIQDLLSPHAPLPYK